MLVHCPACDKKLKVGAEALGKKIRCPHCTEVFRASPDEAPDEHAEAVEVAPPAPRGRRGPPPPPLREAPPPRRRREDEDDYDRDDRDRDDPEEDRDDRRDRRRSRGRRDRDDRDDERDRDDDRDRDDADRGRRGMPGSVMLAIAALGLMLALRLGMSLLVLVVGNLPPAQLGRLLGELAFSVIAGGLILWGLISGHRLAWQWGRVLGLLTALLMLLAGILAFTAGPVQGGMLARFVIGGVTLFISACLFTIVFSLGTQSAKKYFRLRCPECGRYTSSAADFFFNEAKCKSCGEIW